MMNQKIPRFLDFQPKNSKYFYTTQLCKSLNTIKSQEDSDFVQKCSMNEQSISEYIENHVEPLNDLNELEENETIRRNYHQIQSSPSNYIKRTEYHPFTFSEVEEQKEESSRQEIIENRLTQEEREVMKANCRKDVSAKHIYDVIFNKMI